MQITDTLSFGGLERVAVNVANHLPREHYQSYLCVTRAEGPLKSAILPHVRYLHLDRKGRFDPAALFRMVRYIRGERIHIVHVHGTSLFVGALTSVLVPSVNVVWHDHFGRAETEKRPKWLYGTAARSVGGIISVSQELANWAKRELHFNPARVWYIPNFVHDVVDKASPPSLPGVPGFRIVCVANLRPQKDHETLLEALAIVVREIPETHLLLIGSASDPAQLEKVKAAIARHHLAAHVSWLGPRPDVSAILPLCDLGVLSSVSEGLPLALVEYGMAALASVATRVGQCSEVLDNGKAGMLVPALSPDALASAMIALLRSPQLRAGLGERFSGHVRNTYSGKNILARICAVYDSVLSDREFNNTHSKCASSRSLPARSA